MPKVFEVAAFAAALLPAAYFFNQITSHEIRTDIILAAVGETEFLLVASVTVFSYSWR